MDFRERTIEGYRERYRKCYTDYSEGSRGLQRAFYRGLRESSMESSERVHRELQKAFCERKRYSIEGYRERFIQGYRKRSISLSWTSLEDVTEDFKLTHEIFIRKFLTGEFEHRYAIVSDCRSVADMG